MRPASAGASPKASWWAAAHDGPAVGAAGDVFLGRRRGRAVAGTSRAGWSAVPSRMAMASVVFHGCTLCDEAERIRGCVARVHSGSSKAWRRAFRMRFSWPATLSRVSPWRAAISFSGRSSTNLSRATSSRDAARATIASRSRWAPDLSGDRGVVGQGVAQGVLGILLWRTEVATGAGCGGGRRGPGRGRCGRRGCAPRPRAGPPRAACRACRSTRASSAPSGPRPRGRPAAGGSGGGRARASACGSPRAPSRGEDRAPRICAERKMPRIGFRRPSQHVIPPGSH